MQNVTRVAFVCKQRRRSAHTSTNKSTMIMHARKKFLPSIFPCRGRVGDNGKGKKRLLVLETTRHRDSCELEHRTSPRTLPGAFISSINPHHAAYKPRNKTKM